MSAPKPSNSSIFSQSPIHPRPHPPPRTPGNLSPRVSSVASRAEIPRSLMSPEFHPGSFTPERSLTDHCCVLQGNRKLDSLFTDLKDSHGRIFEMEQQLAMEQVKKNALTNEIQLERLKEGMQSTSDGSSLGSEGMSSLLEQIESCQSSPDSSFERSLQIDRDQGSSPIGRTLERRSVTHSPRRGSTGMIAQQQLPTTDSPERSSISFSPSLPPREPAGNWLLKRTTFEETTQMGKECMEKIRAVILKKYPPRSEIALSVRTGIDALAKSYLGLTGRSFYDPCHLVFERLKDLIIFDDQNERSLENGAIPPLLLEVFTPPEVPVFLQSSAKQNAFARKILEDGGVKIDPGLKEAAQEILYLVAHAQRDQLQQYYRRR